MGSEIFCEDPCGKGCWGYNTLTATMASKSPMKVKEFKENVQIEKLPLGKLVYSYAEKESNLGLAHNSRLLLMDTMAGVIGYYNEDGIPPIPIERHDNLKPLKKKAPISSVTCLKLKNKNGIEMKLQEVDFKGKKTNEKWTFTFKNSKMCDDWLKEIDEAKKAVAEKPPISATLPNPQYIQGSRNLKQSPFPTTMSVVRQPPIYPNELLTQTVGSPKKNQLPIDRPDVLPSYLVTSAVDHPALSMNSRVQPPSEMGGSMPPNTMASRISQNFGASRVPESRMIGSVIQPNPVTSMNRSSATNVNYTVPLPESSSKYVEPPPLARTSSYNIPSLLQKSSFKKSPEPESLVQSSGYPKKMESQVIVPQPVLNSRYSERPSPIPPSLEQSKNPKRSVADSSVGKPPIYESGNDRDWNLQFLGSNKPLEILSTFRTRAEAATRSIVDQLGTMQSKRKYIPFEKEPFEAYNVGTLVVILVYLTEEELQYKWLKNEFRNYNYILNVTENKQSIKVPLCAIVDYKGMTALVKARVPKSEEVSFNSIYNELEELERATKVDKETFKICGTFHKFTSGKNVYIFVDNLREYLPVDIQAAENSCQLRGEVVQISEQPLPGGQAAAKRSEKGNKGFSQLDESSRKMREYGSQVSKLMEDLDIVVLNTSEMTRQFHLNGVSMRCLGIWYSQCENPLLKKYFVSEIASRVCKKIIKSELQQEIRRMEESHSSLSSQPNNIMLLDSAFGVLNDICSQNDRSDRIWRVVSQEIKRKFNVSFSKDDLSVGYFLSSLFQKSGLTLNYHFLIKDKNFLRAQNTLRREFVTGFQAEVQSYSIGFTQECRRVNEILNADPNEDGFHELVDILGLRASGLPDYCYAYELDSRIKWYLGNFIAYGSQEYKAVGIYSNVGQEPPTVNSIKQSLLAMKWLRKNPNDQNGNALFEIATDLVSFWGGEYHPLLSDLYDFVAGSHLTAGNYESAVSLGKSSLINCIKISGSHSMGACEKYYQLGDIYFKMGKKEEALSNYQITREILQANKKTNIDEYGLISLKLSLLYLNFSKNSQAASKALEALRIFEQPPVQEQNMLETYEVLARTYEISNQKAELLNLSSLCSKRLPTISNPKVYERMLKIVLYPHMLALPANIAKDLLAVYEQLPKGATTAQATEFLRAITSEHSGLQFPNKLQKADRLLGDITTKGLTGKYKGLVSSNQGEAEEFLCCLQALGTILGDNFVMGVLMEASE